MSPENRIPADRIDDVWQFADGHLYLPSGKLLCPIREANDTVNSYAVTETVNDVLEGADCKRCRRRFTLPPGARGEMTRTPIRE